MHTAEDNTRTRALLDAASRAIASVVAASRRRAAIRQLQSWDDRLLKDIGISRGEIPAVVDAVGRGGEQSALPPSVHAVPAATCGRQAA